MNSFPEYPEHHVRGDSLFSWVIDIPTFFMGTRVLLKSLLVQGQTTDLIVLSIYRGKMAQAADSSTPSLKRPESSNIPRTSEIVRDLIFKRRSCLVLYSNPRREPGSSVSSREFSEILEETRVSTPQPPETKGTRN